jgi:hypothetical protein
VSAYGRVGENDAVKPGWIGVSEKATHPVNHDRFHPETANEVLHD